MLSESWRIRRKYPGSRQEEPHRQMWWGKRDDDPLLYLQILKCGWSIWCEVGDSEKKKGWRERKRQKPRCRTNWNDIKARLPWQWEWERNWLWMGNWLWLLPSLGEVPQKVLVSFSFIGTLLVDMCMTSIPSSPDSEIKANRQNKPVGAVGFLHGPWRSSHGTWRSGNLVPLLRSDAVSCSGYPFVCQKPYLCLR